MPPTNADDPVPTTDQAPAREPEAPREALSTVTHQPATGIGEAPSSPAGPTTGEAPLPSIPGYEMEGVLGRGGMGVVYKARQTSLKRLVAVKVIRCAAQAGPDELQRFRTEAEAVAHLQHPNIVQIYEVGEQCGSPYCVLEFVDGGSLAQKLAGRPLPSVEAARLGESLARAIAYAHQRQIIHRDLKPANVLLTAAGEPKITDFGLAKRLDDDSGQTRTGQIMGTPSYMAPEQAAGDLASVGPRTDVYALGAILYELLTGQPPFRGPNVAQTLQQLQTQDPTPPTRLNPKTPRDLETICLKCLQKDPMRRYGSALQLAQDLERFRGGEAILARPEGVFRKLARKMRRRWPLLASAVALSVTLTVAWFLFMGVLDAQRISASEHDIRVGLDAAPAEWTAAHVVELEGRITRLEALAADRAHRFRDELHQKFHGALDQRIRQPRLEAEDLAPIQDALQAYAGRWPEEAGDLQSLFQQRLGGWQELCAVVAPFTGWESVFGRLDAAPDAAGLVRRGNAGAVTVTTAVPCQGEEEGEVRWDPSWASAPALGLTLNSDERKGYRFLLSSQSAFAQDPNGAGLSTPSPQGPLPAGRRYLQIWRNEQCLREQAVNAPPGPLTLRAGRHGARLEFQLNDLKPFFFEDPFPLPAAGGRLALWWPASVRLSSFHCRRRTKPAAPSPLERGDDLYSGEHYAEALAAYEEAAPTAGAAVGLEARYKAAVCLIELNRLDEAADRLEGVAGADGARWPLLAGNRLWQLRLRQGQPDKAEAVFQSLAAHAGAEDAVLYMLHDVSFDTRGPFYRSKGGFEYLRAKPEDCERIAKTAQSLEVLAYPPSTIDLQYQLLIRNRWAVGQTDQAMKDAAYWLGRCEKGEPTQRLDDAGFTLLNRAWLLGTLGKDKARQAVQEIDQWIAPYRALPDKDVPDVYVECLVQRARLQCVLEDWDAAQQDVAASLRILQDPARVGAPLYLVYAEPYLVDGFLLERRGEVVAARDAWRKGTVQAYRANYHANAGRLFGMSAAASIEIAAAAGDLDDATAEEAMDDMLKAGDEGSVARMTRLAGITPADLRGAMQSPRAHDLARRFAFGQLSFPDWMQGPVLLLLLEKVRAGAFRDALSAEQEEVVWRMGERLLRLYASGALSDTQVLQLVYAWSGAFGGTGPLGWGAVAPMLPAEVRGPLAYVLGNRLVQKKMPSDAEALFRTALGDAPADSPLRRLAQAELDRLKNR